MLLAGFFGLAITTTVSVTPASGVAEVIRAGAASAANTLGTRAAATRTVSTSTPAPSSLTPAAPTWRAACGADSVRWAIWQAHNGSHKDAAAPAHVAAAWSAATSAESGTPAARTPERAVVLQAAAVSAVQVRGPPSRTGS
jgi:hypothetical protein